MGRSSEQSYKTIANYLKQRKVPATINDMIEANIMSRATVYKLLRPEMFPEAALFGVRPLNNTKPFFFTYDEDLQIEILSKADLKTGEIISTHREVMTNAAQQIAANAVVLDHDERILLERFRQHKEANTHVVWAGQNFDRAVPNTEFIYEQLEYMREPIGNDKDKMRTALVSLFVSSFNTSEDE